jgi:competence protein ComGC
MQKQNGNSLLEILLVVAVASILIVLAVRYFTTTSSNLQVVQSVGKIDRVARASYEWLEIERRASFEGDEVVSMQVLVKAGLLRNQDEINPWGGNIKVAPGTDVKHVKISFENISTMTCHNLYQRLKAVAYKQDACSGGTYSGEF